ncbi:MAG: hypothetical protein WC689_01520 [Methylocystis sp.]
MQLDYLTLDQVRRIAETAGEHHLNLMNFIEKIRCLHKSGRLEITGVPWGEPCSFPVATKFRDIALGERYVVLLSVWDDFYLSFDCNGKFASLCGAQSEIIDVRFRPDQVASIWPPRATEGPTPVFRQCKRTELANWMRVRFENRPPLSVDELRRIVLKDGSFGALSKRTIERAICDAWPARRQPLSTSARRR